MKLDPRSFDAFLRDPGAVRAILLYGPDAGLVRDRAKQIVRAVAGALDDPFRVVELERDNWPAMADEIASMSLTGGRRVVWVRDVTDAATNAVQAALTGKGAGLLVLEGGELPGRSKLRALTDKATDATSLACYPLEGRALTQSIQSTLSEFGIRVDHDALTWLGGQLGADQAVTQSEVEKLALYVGRDGQVDITAARTCVGDLAGLTLDDAVFAATSGDVAATDRALELAMAEGANPIAVLRATLMHLQRLQRAKTVMSSGASAADAAKAARPPIFFKRLPGFTQALNLWSDVMLDDACRRVSEAERACKRTGSPAETICRNAVIGLSLRGAARRRR